MFRGKKQRPKVLRRDADEFYINLIAAMESFDARHTGDKRLAMLLAINQHRAELLHDLALDAFLFE